MDFDAPASTWMHLQHAVSLIFDLQNQSRSSIVSTVSFMETAQAVYEISWQQDLSGQTNE